MTTGSQPNILFIFTDQMHRYAMQCMGTDDIMTPNLDRLAAEGTLFRNAYSNCPICTPFRINLFSGQYTCTTQTYGNSHRIEEDCHTLADSLNAGGYRTSYVGKWHIGGKGNTAVTKELRAGFTDFIGYQCYNGFTSEVRFFDEDNREHYFDKHRTDVTTDIAVERLEKLDDEPFAMFVSYQAPHYPVQPSDEFAQMYEGVQIKRRPNCQEVDPYTRTFSPPSPQPPENCPDYQRYGNDLDEYLRLYYAMVTQIDAGVGRLLETLKRTGADQNTIVIFTADHGDMQGSHGLLNKCLPYEESVGIPLIVREPGQTTGQVTDALVSGIDYYPTMLDYAGLPKNEELPGRSIRPFVDGSQSEDSRPVFCEFKGWKSVRLGAYKLVVDSETLKPTHLYQLHIDPYEMTNRVDDVAEARTVEQLHGLIIAWLGAYARA